MKQLEQDDAIRFIHEPKLTFGHNQDHIDPRDGLMLFGPLTGKTTVPGRIGIIGTLSARKKLNEWLQRSIRPVYSLDNDIARPFFPGFEAAFGISINFDAIVEIDINDNDINRFLSYSDSHQRIHNLVNLFANELIRYKQEEMVPVTVWFVVVSDLLYQYSFPKSRIPKSAVNIKIGIRKKENQRLPVLFEEDQQLQEAYKYKLNFHNQLKAKLLKDGIVTQIVRESTVAFRDFKNLYGLPTRDLSKFESDIAWNISTTLYYKMGGIPWKLSSIRQGVCYLGLVYKNLENSDHRSACCAAQMFLDSGDGMVFKAANGKWYNPKTKQYHLDKKTANDMVSKAIETYKKSNNDKFPTQIFIHAQTYFNDEEWSGFIEGSNNKCKIVGVRIRSDSNVKLFREYKYPAPRGLIFIENSRKAYLWSKGFIPKIKTVMGLETPNPLSVEISQGEEDIEIVCADVLALTKLNYNSCKYGDGLPVTLKFAENIGEIITSGPSIENLDVLPFKHYI